MAECIGCRDGLPVRPCAITGEPQHRGPDSTEACRAGRKLDEFAERVTDTGTSMLATAVPQRHRYAHVPSGSVKVDARYERDMARQKVDELQEELAGLKSLLAGEHGRVAPVLFRKMRETTRSLKMQRNRFVEYRRFVRDELDATRGERDQVRKQVEELREELAQAHSAVEAANRERDEALSALNQADRRSESAEMQVIALRNKLEGAKAEISEAHRSAESWAARYAAEHDQLAQVSAELENAVDALSEQGRNNDNALSALESLARQLIASGGYSTPQQQAELRHAVALLAEHGVDVRAPMEVQP